MALRFPTALFVDVEENNEEKKLLKVIETCNPSGGKEEAGGSL